MQANLQLKKEMLSTKEGKTGSKESEACALYQLGDGFKFFRRASSQVFKGNCHCSHLDF